MAPEGRAVGGLTEEVRPDFPQEFARKLRSGHCLKAGGRRKCRAVSYLPIIHNLRLGHLSG
jgi:hypothetical protein